MQPHCQRPRATKLATCRKPCGCGAVFERPTHAPVRRYLPGGRSHFASTLRPMLLPARALPRTVVRREPWQRDCGERLSSRPPPHVRPGKDRLSRTPCWRRVPTSLTGSSRRAAARLPRTTRGGGASTHAPLSSTEALVLDVGGFLRSRTRQPCQPGAWMRRLRPLRMLRPGDSGAAFDRLTPFTVAASGDSVPGGTRVPFGAHAPHGAPR